MSESNRVSLELRMQSQPGDKYWSYCQSVKNAPSTLGEISDLAYRLLSDDEKGAYNSPYPFLLQLTAHFITKELISCWEENKRLAEKNKKQAKVIKKQDDELRKGGNVTSILKTDLDFLHEQYRELVQEKMRLSEENKKQAKVIKERDDELDKFEDELRQKRAKLV